MLPEDPAEVAGILKAAGHPDLKDGLPAFQQHLPGNVDPVILQVRDGGKVQISAEAALYFPLADAGARGHVRECDRLGIMMMNIVQDGPGAAGVE